MGNVQLLGQLYSQAFGAVMLTSKAYLQQAAERMLTRNRSWAGWKMRRHQDIAGLTWNGSTAMLSAHITSFLKLINIQLEETSRGVTSSHHFHNVQCGIENILCLLEYNNDLVDKADQLSLRASNYITRHDMISSKISERDISEDADRLRATYEAIAGFRFAVEHSQPNSRVRTLGLAWHRIRTAFRSCAENAAATLAEQPQGWTPANNNIGTKMNAATTKEK
jgi:hypothetical protein